MSIKTIGIDMGHTLSGSNFGAVGIIKESIETREIGNRVIRLLQEQGCKIVNCTVDTASSNTTSINTRVAKANAQALDLFVSIHFNASNGQGQGVEVLTANGKSLPEAERVLKNISAIGFRNRGIKNGTSPRRIGVVNSTRARAMLVEVCFIDNQADVELYKKNIDNITKAIVEGIIGSRISSSNTSSSKEEINIGDDDMIADSVKVFANPNSPIKEEMIENIKALQGVYKLPVTGVADEKLVKSLLELKGHESKGIVTLMQRILIAKGCLSKGSDTGVIGEANRNGINRFKESVSIPLNTVLVDRQTWRKLIEY